MIACVVACGGDGENPAVETSDASPTIDDYGDDCSTYCGEETLVYPEEECAIDDDCQPGEVCEETECVLDPALAVPDCASASVTFADPVVLAYGSYARVAIVANADATDVVAADYEGALHVLGESPALLAIEGGVNDIDAMDVDQDGDRDFVAFASGTKLVSYLHTDGVYTEGPVSPVSASGGIYVTFADLDGDAFPDAVIDDFATLVVHDGIGDGSFGEPEVVVYEPVCGLAGREEGGGVAFSRGDGAIFVDAGDPSSAWNLAKLVAPVDVRMPCASAFGDFDGDGVVDLFVVQERLQGLATRWDGVRDSPTADAWSMPTSGEFAVAADLDGDGDEEAITRAGTALVFRDVATAETSAGCIASIDRPLGPDAGVAAIGDLDANGRADLVGYGSDGVVVAYAED